MSTDKRTENFTEAETNLLIELVKKYKHIIECKKSDVYMWKDKEKAWEELTGEFNNNAPKSQRTSKNLRGKWDNLKKNTKKKFAAEKIEIYKTGGGLAMPISISSMDNEIKDIIGVAVTGLCSTFDSDFVPSSLDHNYSIADENVGPEVRNEVEVASTSVISSKLNKNSWNPNLLRNPISAVLKESVNKDVTEDVTFNNSLPGSSVKVTQTEVASGSGTSGKSNWKSWNPNLLKNPVSTVLRETYGNVDENINSGLPGSSVKEIQIPRKGCPRKKTELTTDCRIKINSLSEAKLQLIGLQQIILKEEMEWKKKEYETRIQIMKEEHQLNIEKQKCELSLLRKKLDRD